MKTVMQQLQHYVYINKFLITNETFFSSSNHNKTIWKFIVQTTAYIKIHSIADPLLNIKNIFFIRIYIFTVITFSLNTSQVLMLLCIFDQHVFPSVAFVSTITMP